MPPEHYLDVLRRESTAFDAAAAGTDPAAPVPGCPGWTVADLTWHVAEVQHFWGTLIGDRLESPASYEEPVRPAAHDETLAFYRAAATRLIDVLGRTDPASRVWTWSDDHTAGWVLRRQAHEIVVHRRDAEAAAGAGAVPIGADLAADGIDEMVTYFLGNIDADAPAPGGSVALVCTDSPHRWVVSDDGAGAYAVSRGGGDGDAELRGPAEELLLQLWRRRPLGAGGVEITGDAAVAQRLVGRTDLA